MQRRQTPSMLFLQTIITPTMKIFIEFWMFVAFYGVGLSETTCTLFPDSDSKINTPVVNTDCGPVDGVSKDGAYSFRGIPYALPPVGSRRWKPPIPLSKESKTCWSGSFDGSLFGNTCLQYALANPKEIVGSEDCLYLNVWTPTLNPGAKLNVMVWIHGGFLTEANANWPTYSPTEQLANETNTVYVGMNYRLHAFGFLALDILTKDSKTNTSGNYGFMDQILALQWVQRNVANFGGDPTKVSEKRDLV